MSEFNAKSWFRSNIAVYLTAIAVWVKGLINPLATRITDVENTVTSLASIGGVFKGIYATEAEFPTAKTGDFAYLADTNGNATAIYKKTATGWVFVSDLQTALETMSNFIATDAEADDGTLTTKALSVLQAQQKISTAMSTCANNVVGYLSPLISGKADLAGNISQVFSVAPAEAGTNNAVNANQFTDIVTSAEAQADWDAASV